MYSNFNNVCIKFYIFSFKFICNDIQTIATKLNFKLSTISNKNSKAVYTTLTQLWIYYYSVIKNECSARKIRKIIDLKCKLYEVSIARFSIQHNFIVNNKNIMWITVEKSRAYRIIAWHLWFSTFHVSTRNLRYMEEKGRTVSLK